MTFSSFFSKTLFSPFAVASVFFAPLLFPEQSKAFALVSQTPFANVAPAYTTTCLGNCLTFTQDSSFQQSSYGFYFETTQDVIVNGLGFSSQPGWPNGLSNYTVELWKYDLTGSSVIEQSTFVPAANGGPDYAFNSGFFWQEFDPSTITLLRSDNDPDLGYFLLTRGDFRDLPGNVGAELVTSSAFNPLIVYDGNGINLDPLDPDFPVLLDQAVDGNNEPYTNGFFNANISLLPGQAPEVPVLPPDPVTPTDPWVFPPVVVIPDFPFWYDPLVSIGYIYNVTGGPKFKQYIAPNLPFNTSYQILGLNGGASCTSTNPDDFNVLLGTAQGNTLSPPTPPYTAFDFTTSPAGGSVDCFALKGIDLQNNLDPANTSAFLAGLIFDSAGTVNVTQSPIAVPGPLPILGAGMAYGWAARLRKRAKAA